jgi:hypothetical protein
VAQYAFPLNVGNDETYGEIAAGARAAGFALGGDLLPAATGAGPDFFLAARAFRDYSGLYCLVEVPKPYWELLPDSAVDGPLKQNPPVAPEEAVSLPVSGASAGSGSADGGDAWKLEPLLPEAARALEEAGFIPAALRQENLRYLPPSGWAATGRVRGVDGNLRRWIYRYFFEPGRPTLNWADPGGGARLILNGSVIRQVGIFGGVLSGYSVQPFIGLEKVPDAPARPEGTAPGAQAPAGEIPSDIYALAAEASGNLARQTRSYGGWSWLRDELPLPLLRALLRDGPDFALDSVTSPGAEHALLTGKAELLNFMLDEALAEGVDFRRLAHKSVGTEGLSYLLPHLQYLIGQADAPASGRLARAGELYRVALLEAQGIGARKEGQEEIAGQPDFVGHRLYSTPAGLAAAALELPPDEAADRFADGDGLLSGAPPERMRREDMDEIERGHRLLVFFKAMQPGLLMLGGQDLSGALPLAWRDIADGKHAGRFEPGELRNLDGRAASLGAYPLLRAAAQTRVNAQGFPEAQSLYGPLDEQAHNPDSFLNRLGEMIRLRERLGIGQSVLAGRLRGRGAGLVCLVLKTGESGPFILSIGNFARTGSTESLNPQDAPGLALALRRGRARLLYGNLQHMDFNEKRLNFSLPAWEGALILVESRRRH